MILTKRMSINDAVSYSIICFLGVKCSIPVKREAKASLLTFV